MSTTDSSSGQLNDANQDRQPTSEVPAPAARTGTHDIALLDEINYVDRNRLQIGQASIFWGFFGMAVVFVWGAGSLSDYRFFELERMSSPGYPYLLTSRAIVAASAIGACFGLVRVGQRMLLPATFVRDMAKGSPQEPSDSHADLATATAALVTAVTAALPGVTTKR